MPLGFERINERTSRPSSHINFIRTLPGPSSAHAQDFLSRIAAISHPILKAHHIYIQALEEYPPNPEFIGRNFNAGEVIQLVLKDRSGRWLPFRNVQLVMMHEMAHCKQMNHSGAFWKVRDAYARELRGLWEREYTGDGLWGRGKTVLQEGYEREDGADVDVPEHLCGGTFRTKGRKGRKRRRGGKEKGEELSYVEKKQRRILKKFGAGGTALGDDERRRKDLEGGKPVKGKPRVAGSSRGRELRAAAALARFEQVKKEEPKQEDTETDSETDYEEGDSWETAIDLDGTKMTDTDGRDMVKICEDEDERDDNARKEMAELYGADGMLAMRPRKKDTSHEVLSSKVILSKKTQTKTASKTSGSAKLKPPDPKSTMKEPSKPSSSKPKPPSEPQNVPTNHDTKPEQRSTHECPVCSLVNEPVSITCLACANVLNTQLLPNHWKCKSVACQGSAYINAGDSGICGVCGATKSP